MRFGGMDEERGKWEERAVIMKSIMPPSRLTGDAQQVLVM